MTYKLRLVTTKCNRQNTRPCASVSRILDSQPCQVAAQNNEQTDGDNQMHTVPRIPRTPARLNWPLIWLLVADTAFWVVIIAAFKWA